MENMLDKDLKVARSDTVKASGKTLFKDIIGILMYDPTRNGRPATATFKAASI